MDLSLQSIKPTTVLQITLKKHVTSMSGILEPAIQSGDSGQPYPNPNRPPTHTHPATSSLQLQDYKAWFWLIVNLNNIILLVIHFDFR